ncbi:hypothetical protein [Saccharothrix variisporea]|uniref:Uncharacterized protein n=1 Tax=Saccharothrix variisporea TaxID=543527 RepID=A0A495X1J5_9PSEU|nr:hypothetical protein [Saccharothrix variisporea]RKT67717.1 hypothetical protein DFJ66_0893 [Saccharothrix variisporea]
MKILFAFVGTLACAAAMIGGALLVMRGPSDPHAYPSSWSKLDFGEAQEVSAVALPPCAQETAKYYVDSTFVGNSVYMDFTAPDGCVAEFLAAVGIDGNTPVVQWKPVFPDSGPPISPPADSEITWDFGREDRVESWQVERWHGAYEQAVNVVVNRSAQPQHVYIESFTSN